MIPTYLSANWTALATAIGNHLWQSTFCLVVAGVLTLAFRKNHARVRYGLWLAASIKFLIPFSLLIILGNNLAKPRVVYQADTSFFSVMQEASQPFSRPVAHVPTPEAYSPTDPTILPAILAAIWLCGFAAVVILWFVRWRRIRSIVQGATPVREGRELMALRRVEGWAGVRKPIEFVSSQATLEPGVFGIFKPVLIWPQGISPKLEDAHLEAILAHEAWHVRRRDNVASAIHMLVEAVFWFHPMVWWLGSRLVAERERACDEEVLQFGSKPNIYAESILKTCEFCVESPLACVSGITGADLKRRIVHIMTDHAANKLTLGGKLLLAAIATTVMTAPIVFGLINPPETHAQAPATTSAPLPSFEVASIKPDRSGDARSILETRPAGLHASGVTIKKLIAYAYGLEQYQVSGGPGWVSSDQYRVEAKVDDSQVEQIQKLPLMRQDDPLVLMLQSLLADRFKLKLSHTTKELPVFALVVARNGPKLQATKPGNLYPAGTKSPNSHAQEGLTVWRDRGASMDGFAEQLSRHLGRPVLDRTGLKGRYDFTVEFARDQTPMTGFKGPEGGGPAPGAENQSDSSGPTIFTALREQLGLKLESAKGPVEVLVIDHIERPSEN